MGNLRNFNFRELDIKLSNSDYWDFFLSDDSTPIGPIDFSSCLIVDFDFNNPDIYTPESPNTISSLATWTGATNTGYTLNTIGLTGIDNGLVTFVKDPSDPTNQAMLIALTGSTLLIPSGDNRLHLNLVSGMTNNFIYPVNIIPDINDSYAQFCGGFYQGYYKIDGTNYQVFPDRMHDGFTLSFRLKRDNTLCSGGPILNDLYPNNKGLFFYMGTRAENKFWDLFNGADTGCTSACTATTACTETISEWCTIPKESQMAVRGILHTGDTITLYPDQTTRTEVTNPFLIYGQAGRGNSSYYPCNVGPSGFGNETVWSYDGKPKVIITPKTVITNHQNPFLIYGQAGRGNSSYYPCNVGPSGFGNETVWSFTGFTKSIEFENIDYSLDIIDNALGFRIRDDGSIGYRLLTVTGSCSGTTYSSGVTVHEGYSDGGLIADKTWVSVIIRYSTDYLTDCDFKIKPARSGKLMFYINGKLKFIVNSFPEFIGKRLNEHMEKQIGVPFIMSLGGGTQGLIETLTFDGIDLGDLGLPIEHNFAGSFIGGISNFSFYACDLNFIDIQYIYNSMFGVASNDDLITEDNDNIVQENNFKITIE